MAGRLQQLGAPESRPAGTNPQYAPPVELHYPGARVTNHPRVPARRRTTAERATKTKTRETQRRARARARHAPRALRALRARTSRARALRALPARAPRARARARAHEHEHEHRHHRVHRGDGGDVTINVNVNCCSCRPAKPVAPGGPGGRPPGGPGTGGHGPGGVIGRPTHQTGTTDNTVTTPRHHRLDHPDPDRAARCAGLALATLPAVPVHPRERRRHLCASGRRPVLGEPGHLHPPRRRAGRRPPLPPTLAGIGQAGADNTIYAHVWNLGQAPAFEVLVEFYWFNRRSASAARRQPDRRRVDVARPRGGAGSHTVVKCPVSWKAQ